MWLHSVSFCTECTFANWLFNLTLRIRKYFMRLWTSFYLSRDLQLSSPTSKESLTSIMARHWAQWELSFTRSWTDPMQFTPDISCHTMNQTRALRWPVRKALAAAHVWRPERDPCNPFKGERQKTTPWDCPLTSTWIQWHACPQHHFK